MKIEEFTHLGDKHTLHYSYINAHNEKRIGYLEAKSEAQALLKFAGLITEVLIQYLEFAKIEIEGMRDRDISSFYSGLKWITYEINCKVRASVYFLQMRRNLGLIITKLNQ